MDGLCIDRLGFEGSSPKSFLGILGEGEEFPSTRSADQGTDLVSFLVGANDLGALVGIPN